MGIGGDIDTTIEDKNAVKGGDGENPDDVGQANNGSLDSTSTAVILKKPTTGLTPNT